MNLLARLRKFHMIVIAFHGFADCRRRFAFLRYVRQRDINQLSFIALNKCRALQGREENLPIHALPFMIHDGIFIGITRRQLGISGSQAGPYFRTDITAAAVFVSIVNQP